MRWLQGNGGIGAAVLMGLLTSVLIFSYLGQGVKTVSVLVARSDIASFTRLDPSLIGTENIPESAVHPLALGGDRLSLVCGQYAVTPMVAGEQIISRKISPAPSGALTGAVPDMRAVAVPARFLPGLRDLVAPGSSVDLIYITEEFGDGYNFSKALFQGVRVLGILDMDGLPIDETNSGTAPSLLAVALPLPEVEALAYALNHGHFIVAACPPEQSPVATAGVDQLGFYQLLLGDTSDGDESGDGDDAGEEGGD